MFFFCTRPANGIYHSKFLVTDYPVRIIDSFRIITLGIFLGDYVCYIL